MSRLSPARLIAVTCLALGLAGTGATPALAAPAAGPDAVPAAVGDDVIAFVEVEDGVISGGAAGPPALNSGDHGNFSGSGSYTFRETGMASTMTVTAPAAGTYPVYVRYAAGPLSAEENVTRSMGLLTNGGARQQLSYPMTSFENWEAWRFVTTQVTLNAGANTIAVQCDRSVDFCRLNFDAIQVGGTAPDPCPATPTDPGYTRLYDGTFDSFDGWRKAGAGGFGRQLDCSILSLRGRGATWFTTQQTAPYTLEVDWKRTDANDDSSVYVGSSSRGGADPVGGYAIAIGDGTGAIKPAGGTAQAPDATAVAGALRPVGQWNTFTIALTATQVKVSLNGTVVNTYTTTTPNAATGFVGLENRSFLDSVAFRDIQVRQGVDPEPPTTREIQVLGTGGLQGHLVADGDEAGLATLAGAVDQLRAANPDTVLAGTGDLIGGSPFPSYVADDAPTIDALDEAGLDVSAVGNHELDRGLADLTGRVADRADWDYLAANLRTRADGSRPLAASWTTTFGEVEVGFVGAVTEGLPSLVDPAGIAEVTVTDVVDEVDAEAAALETAGADVVVLLVDASPALLSGVGGSVDAILAGHTGTPYDQAVPVPDWVEEGRSVTTRPVVSAGAHGTHLARLTFTVDTATGDVTAGTHEVLPLVTSPAYPVDAATQTIVDAAVARADVLGAEPLATVTGPLTRGATGDSPLGNLVAEAQRSATGAQVAFVAADALAADLAAAGGTVTLGQGAAVQPEAESLVSARLTGRQLATLLEQRPGLGSSDGFRWTIDPTRPAGSRVTGMWLDDVAIVPSTTYTVASVESLAIGGTDTGRTDLAALLDHLAASSPVTPDLAQHVVGVSFPGGRPSSYVAGDQLAVDLTLLRTDAEVTVSLAGTALGSFPVADGAASVRTTIPTDTAAGAAVVTIIGTTTGTTVTLPVTVTRPVLATSATALGAPASVAVMRGRATVSVAVAAPGTSPTGTADVYVDGAKVSTVTLREGRATATVGPFGTVGPHSVQVRYLGDGTTAPSVSRVARITVAKAAPRLTVRAPARIVAGRTRAALRIVATAPGLTPSGTVTVRVRGAAYVGKLRGGRVVIRLPRLARPGPARIVVRYAGDARTMAASTATRIVVRKR